MNSHGRFLFFHLEILFEYQNHIGCLTCDHINLWFCLDATEQKK